MAKKDLADIHSSYMRLNNKPNHMNRSKSNCNQGCCNLEPDSFFEV